jgi:purine-cytosine permease-like protein
MNKNYYRWETLSTERVIHASIFVLLLVGLGALSVWAILTYIPPIENIILIIGTVALSWGIILLATYLSFNKLGWKWWSYQNYYKIKGIKEEGN